MKKIISILSIITLSLFSFTSLDASMLNQETSFNNLVIFIKFADEIEYIAPFDLGHYEDLFNADDQTSLKDYFLEATYDQLTINSYLVSNNNDIIWFQDSHVRSYYEEYDSSTNPNGVKEDEQAEREHALLKRAVDYVDDNNLVPDDLILDSNDDGSIDSITFMISGEDCGWNSLLWPHMWNLYTFQDNDYNYTYDAPSINGVYALDYTFELLGNSQEYYNQVQVGVLAHETFHLLSAPDLYHYYEYTYVTPVGNWGLMDGTSDTPSHMLGYMKYKYGNWIDEIETITESGTYTLYPLQDSADNIYKIPTGYPDEYIYLEYRDDTGLYESTLPNTGLLVYRVNSTLNGNVDGSYDSDGNPTDEIWVFRPSMDDTELPIVLEDTDFYIDGVIDDAALSDKGSFDSAGETQDIMLFNGAGDLINISINNADEHEGYITFDIILPPSITLNSKTNLQTDNVILLDHPSMDYTVNINNFPVDSQIYFTTDGSTPTSNSPLLESTTLPINATNNIVSLAIYINGELIQTYQKEFLFNTTIESSHNPYGNELDIYWYLDFGTTTSFDITSDNRSFLEDQYDFLHIKDSISTSTYTGNNLSSFTINHISDFLLVNLSTDEFVDDDYGFKLELDVKSSLLFDLNGESNVTLPINTDYNELGVALSGLDKDLYTVETNGTVNTSIPGIYEITYTLVDSDEAVVQTIIRSIEVVDTTSPEVTLNGDDVIYLEAGSNYEELGLTATDNYDIDLTTLVSGTVSKSTVGTTILTYTVSDDYGNSTVVTRTVIVQDTKIPTVILEAGLDTITVGNSWILGGITIKDETETIYTVTGSVQNNIPGQYIITYSVTDEGGNTVTIERYVTVVEEVKKLSITCNPFEATITANSTTDIGDCFVGNELMLVNTSNINYSVPGQYEILYTLEDEGFTYNKIQYIYILHENNSEVAYIERKEYL
jgi:M6 family metalloprotease-like protein